MNRKELKQMQEMAQTFQQLEIQAVRLAKNADCYERGQLLWWAAELATDAWAKVEDAMKIESQEGR